MQIPGENTKDYGMGLAMEPYRGLRSVSHGGALGGYRTEMLRFPDEKFTVICLCNNGSANASGLARRIADAYLADKLKTGAGEAGQETSEADGQGWYAREFEGLFASSEVPAEWRMVTEKRQADAQRGLSWSIR